MVPTKSVAVAPSSIERKFKMTEYNGFYLAERVQNENGQGQAGDREDEVDQQSRKRSDRPIISKLLPVVEQPADHAQRHVNKADHDGNEQ